MRAAAGERAVLFPTRAHGTRDYAPRPMVRPIKTAEGIPDTRPRRAEIRSRRSTRRTWLAATGGSCLGAHDSSVFGFQLSHVLMRGVVSRTGRLRVFWSV